MSPKRSSPCLAATILAAAAFAAPLPADAAKLKIVYDFNSGPGCGNPAGNMAYVQGNLYGTTIDSGVGPGYGCLFQLDPKTGIETEIHIFAGGTDGLMPLSGVVAHGTMLYGTTSQGAIGFGTVFAYDIATGAEKTLYAFKGSPDAGTSSGGLLYLNGALYGTSEFGGATLFGSVFKVDATTGAETVLHSFKYGDDGARPITGLTLFNGMLYGTTRYGGTRDCRGRKGCGTVFMTDPQSGATAVVYRFTGGTDGAHPYAALTVQGGILYGTTLQGGSTTCGSGYGCGTAFALDPTTGKETVLHSFTGHDDGTFPDAPVTAFNGTLYGTTFSGGGGGCNLDGGCGTIYTLNPSTGAEAVLFALHQKTGFFPFLSLTLHGKTIYGAAADGGTGCLYCGTVFAFKP